MIILELLGYSGAITLIQYPAHYVQGINTVISWLMRMYCSYLDYRCQNRA